MAEAMLDATEKLLADRALDELTVVDIITEAGVSRATFYLYFESKHAVVATLAHDVVQKIFQAGWAMQLARTEPMTEMLLTDLWTDTIKRWREHGPVLLAAAQGWRRQHSGSFERWGSAFRDYSRIVADYINAARRTGYAPDGPDADGLAAALVWMSENMMYLTLTGDAPELADSEKLATILASVWTQTIGLRLDPREP